MCSTLRMAQMQPSDELHNDQFLHKNIKTSIDLSEVCYLHSIHYAALNT